ncbi:MAG: flagellar hook capping FlgD N-terminal domain-containing protein [Acidimicrobiales bacterium]|jgi:flagellar basal-body rod modification protein FlgD
MIESVTSATAAASLNAANACAADASTSPTGDTSTTGSASSSSSNSGMNSLLAPNEFLSLLVDNLKYQDPLDPTSSADLLTQLASLSQVQTQQQIAETDQTSAAANLIGDTIAGSDASGLAVTGTVSGFSITSSGPTLEVGKDSVSLGDVSSVTAPTQSSAT